MTHEQVSLWHGPIRGVFRTNNLGYVHALFAAIFVLVALWLLICFENLFAWLCNPLRMAGSASLLPGQRNLCIGTAIAAYPALL